MRKVQDIFRSTFPGAWEKGWSHCYNDVTYGKHKSRRRYKFTDLIRGGIPSSGKEHHRAKLDFENALVAEGYAVETITMSETEVYVYILPVPHAITPIVI